MEFIKENTNKKIYLLKEQLFESIGVINEGLKLILEFKNDSEEYFKIIDLLNKKLSIDNIPRIAIYNTGKKFDIIDDELYECLEKISEKVTIKHISKNNIFLNYDKNKFFNNNFKDEFEKLNNYLENTKDNFCNLVKILNVIGIKNKYLNEFKTFFMNNSCKDINNNNIKPEIKEVDYSIIPIAREYNQRSNTKNPYPVAISEMPTDFVKPHILKSRSMSNKSSLQRKGGNKRTKRKYSKRSRKMKYYI